MLSGLLVNQGIPLGQVKTTLRFQEKLFHFNPGETVKMVTLDIVNDNEIEQMEFLSVFLHEPRGGLAAIDPTMDTAEVTIDYDDYEISISDPSPILEGNSGVKKFRF